jgi:hypothetical protein
MAVFNDSLKTKNRLGAIFHLNESLDTTKQTTDATDVVRLFYRDPSPTTLFRNTTAGEHKSFFRFPPRLALGIVIAHKYAQHFGSRYKGRTAGTT